MLQYEIEWVERDVVERLDKGEKVYLESGCAIDGITGYSIRKYKRQAYEEKEVTFTTTAYIFPKEIMLSNWENVDTKEFEGKLFVHVW